MYPESLIPADKGLLAEITAYTEATYPRGAHMLSGPYQGRLLAMLSKLTQPRLIVEVGTFTGYATICLAEGLAPEGKLITLDRDERLETPIRAFFDRSSYKDQIDFWLGPALDSCARLPEGIDLCFVDADKRAYQDYLEALLPKMRPGGLLIFDNVLWKGRVESYVLDEADPADVITTYLATFNARLSADPRLETLILPVRDGLLLARVR